MMAIRIDSEHDHYLHITATFLATSFGRALPVLVRMRQSGTFRSGFSFQLGQVRQLIYTIHLCVEFLMNYGAWWITS